ncbi:MAG: LysM peptidoglycan-binding domain-containing protein [Candidatus Delongbacteria bacterium]|jgi:nucleoid-associated protein YgaU|nr:LysM peptidoglycan-binding domain-containing protein [Candidatus Delongbacteria bacterium]
MKKLILSVLILTFFALSFAQEEVNYEEEYLPKLTKVQSDLTNTEAEIVTEEATIADLNVKIEEKETAIENTWTEIYTAVGSDDSGVDEYRNNLNALESKIRSFGALPAEELYKRRAELDDFDAELTTMRADQKSALTEFMNKIERIDQKIKSVRSSIVVPYVMSYVVQRGDNLWKISGKSDIYDDPFKWTDIYKANKETISSWQRKYNAVLKEGQEEADLIYPDQEFTIPR